MRVAVLGSRQHNRFTNGGAEIFDMAGRGKIGAFFLSGGQIDGQANINLVGTGDYPSTDVRWSGSFGSAYLYFMVPRVILFRWEHSRRTLVRQVDFISAPGRSDPGVHRPGGPIALMTNLCLFRWQRDAGRARRAVRRAARAAEGVGARGDEGAHIGGAVVDVVAVLVKTHAGEALVERLHAGLWGVAAVM